VKHETYKEFDDAIMGLATTFRAKGFPNAVKEDDKMSG